MARITRDSSVLNQIGSPSINSNTFANRPSFGQTGRLFVDTTNNILQRDTGTSWVTIGGAGSTPNLEAVTTIGNTSTKGIFLGLTGSLSVGLQFEVSGYSRFSQTVASATNLGSNVNQYFELQTNGTAIVTGSPSAGYSQLTIRNNAAQTIGGAGNVAIGAGLFENVITDSGTGSYPLTITQTVGISALSPIISYSRYTGTFGSAISHYAGLVINGIQATAGSAIGITNNYQLLINSSQQFSGSTTVTNRWGIYQAGSNDKNYFAGQVFVNSTTEKLAGDTFYVNGTTRSEFIVSEQTMYCKGTGLRILNGNVIIGDIVDSGRILIVGGEQEWKNITYGTGTHTTSGNHLPIWVNGVKYWLALLNPPILP